MPLMNKLFSNVQATTPPPTPLPNNSVTGASATNSNVLTFIKDRLFFTCFQSPPSSRPDVHYFTIDHVLVYQHFYADFGPLNLAQVLRFCNILQKLLQEPELANKRIVMYSSPASDKKANALFLLCMFLMLVGKQSPEQACQPIASVADTIVPFRDAGYGPDTYHITILDCCKGLSKAMSHQILNMAEFDLEEYEYYEKVEHGDMNWLMNKKFLACATPHDDPPTATNDPNYYPKTPANLRNENILSHGIPWRLNDYVNYFKKNKITTVIRLNHKVYERQRFVEQGIEHIELYFHDGSCPSMEILQTFLDIVESDRKLAIHCKAGLGRTGSLIAAYLMKHYRFTASEIIGYLRVIRPGSVVGPQQNWLQSMQSTLWAMGNKSQVPRTIFGQSSQHFTAPGSSSQSHYVLESSTPSQQMAIHETAVPATKTTIIGNQTVSIPVQPRKGNDQGASSLPSPPPSPPASMSDASEGQDFSMTTNTMQERYNMRASTVAARSNPNSRSNSVTFDHSTPRTTSNASLKMKTALMKIQSNAINTNHRNGFRRNDGLVNGRVPM